MEVRTTEPGPGAVEETIPTQRRTPPDAPTHLDRISQTAALALGVSHVCVYLVDSGDGSETCVGLGSDVLAPFCQEIASDIQSVGGTIVDSDSTSSPFGDGTLSGSYIALPIAVSAKLTGVFCAFDYSDRTFSEEEIELARQFEGLASSELQRQRELQLLRKKEGRLRLAAESARPFVAILDRSARFTHISPSAHSVFGSQATPLIGMSLYDRVYGEDLVRVRSALEAHIRREESNASLSPSKKGPTYKGSAHVETEPDADRILEIEFRTKRAGGLRHLHLRGTKLSDRRGDCCYVIHVRDVTDGRIFDAEILNSRDRSAKMSRLKSAFLSNVSHEIRTPLTTILGFAEILADEVDGDSREFVQLIQEGGERLLDTLMSILDLARLESSSFAIVDGQFDVAEKVSEICRLMEPIAEEKGLFLKFDPPGSSIDAVMDVFAVERVVTNLVSNGIKFTKEGGVTVSVEADDDHILIHVADSGMGIGEELMPFLFTDIRQESEGLTRRHEGSGLGLSVTKRLVELMKGNIMAESEKGRGTVFTVALPRQGEASVIDASDTGAGAEESPTRVLVVEDNADTRTLVNHLLRKNYEVRCAADADDALRLAAERRYDVLLVDINLGKGKSGEDVLNAVKSLSGYQDTPVIAVTAYAMPGDRERFFAAGFDDYVSKPFSKQRLLEALEGVLA